MDLLVSRHPVSRMPPPDTSSTPGDRSEPGRQRQRRTTRDQQSFRLLLATSPAARSLPS